MEEDSISLTTAVDFIIAVQTMKPVDKTNLKKMALVVYEHSRKHGLPTKHMKNLAFRVLSTDSYDATIKRRLLYSFIPERPEAFPYEILPCIMSSVYPSALMSPTSQRSWVTTVLIWLLSMLKYNILDTENTYVRLCYLPCFNMLGIFRYTRVCSEILYQLTRRVDVTPLRVRYLNELRKKKGFISVFMKLLRLYSTIRPDLLIITTEGTIMSNEVRVSSILVPGLDACLGRGSGGRDDADDEDDLWSSVFQRQKLNPYLRNTVLPVPKITNYASTLEEKKEQQLSVMQCSKLRQLITAIPSSHEWMWPNSSASLLRRPVLLVWFRPHHYRSQIALESWLDVTLTTEVLQQRGSDLSAHRSADLLRRVVTYVEQQVVSGGLCSPVVQQFLLSYLMLWDQQQHLGLVLRLVRCLGNIESFTSVVLSRLLPLLATAPITVACAVIRTITGTAVNWCLLYDTSGDVLDDGGFAMVEGVLQLQRQLDGPFVATLVQHRLHPMLLHTVIGFYVTVNTCCSVLQLPLFVCPSPALTALVVSTEDAGAIHRLGTVLAGLSAAYARLDDEFVSCGRYVAFCEEVFQLTNQHSVAVELYLAYCYDASMFSTESDVWSGLCSTFLGTSTAEQLRERINLQKRVTAPRGLQCAALCYEVATARTTAGNNNSLGPDKEQYGEVRDAALQHLYEADLTGLQDCVAAHQKQNLSVEGSREESGSA